MLLSLSIGSCRMPLAAAGLAGVSAAAAAHVASASSWRRGSVGGSWLSRGRGGRGGCGCWVWAAARKAAVEGQCCSGRGSGGGGTVAVACCCRRAAARCAIECSAAQWIATPERPRLQACSARAGGGLVSWVLEQQPPAAMAATDMSAAAIGALARPWGDPRSLAACCERAQQRIPSAARASPLWGAHTRQSQAVDRQLGSSHPAPRSCQPHTPAAPTADALAAEWGCLRASARPGTRAGAPQGSATR